MRGLSWFIGGAMLVLAEAAHAHAHLEAAVPSEGSTVSAPEHIVLTFSEPARITALTLQRRGEEGRRLSPPAAAAAQATIAVPKLAPGQYTLSWRALSADGHVTSGQLHFTVADLAAGGAAEGTGR